MDVAPIETSRLRLRPFASDLSDLDALHEIQSDPEHMRYYPHPFTREESRAWIERSLERQERLGYSLWAIEDRATGEFLGNCGPIPQVVDEVPEVELGWSVTPRRARQGIATEAAAAWRDRCLAPGGPGSLRPGSVGPGSLGPGSLGPGSLGPGSLGPGSLGMDHVISLIRPENVPSRGVAERIGMTVWKETLHGSMRWPHLVYRVDAADVARA
jgi:RimJ/RimL family protein N-acetyltransferase